MAVGGGDLFQGKDLVARHAEPPGFDLAHNVLQRRVHKILRPAGIDGEAHRAGDFVHRAERLQHPLVANHPGDAHGALGGGAAQRIAQSRRAHQFKHMVDTIGKSRPHLLGDGAIVDKHLVGAVFKQPVAAPRLAGGGGHA